MYGFEFFERGSLMEKKRYDGLEVEYISFGDSSITTTAVPDASTCILGAVTNFTSDQDYTPVPIGQCWVPNPDYYGLDWKGESGSYIP